MAPTIDGKYYQKMILAGANRVITKQEELNKINVFPVPDGDTGSNMAFTFASIASEIHIDEAETASIDKLSEIHADAAINGAHGNSGSILAQFFQGLSQGFAGKQTITLQDFAIVADQSATMAREAIENPVEGTIITVMHTWGEWIVQHWSDYNDLQTFFSDSLVVAEKSLADTPKLLKVLAQNHVVDAGAQGFVNFLQGINDLLLIGHIDEIPSILHQEKNKPAESYSETAEEDVYLTPHVNDVSTVENITNQFCTECIIHGKDLNVGEIRTEMSRWGDSLVTVGNPHKVKVHVHTNAPEKVFRKANEYGEVLETKAEDMWAQYRASINWVHGKQIAIVTDSSCSLPQDFYVKYNIIMLPLQVIINNDSYLDRVNLSYDDFIKALLDKNNRVSTSQASIPDMKAVFEKALRQSDEVIMITLSSGISGTYNNLKKLAERFEEENITVIDSKNAAGGQGMVVAAAAQAAHEGKPLEAVIHATEKAVKTTRQFISLSTLAYAVRGGRVKKSTGTIATALQLLPVLQFNNKGEMVKAGLGFTPFFSRLKAYRLAVNCAKQLHNPKFIISQIECEAAANRIAKKLQQQFKLNTPPPVVATTPVIATHAGPGTIGISVSES